MGLPGRHFPLYFFFFFFSLFVSLKTCNFSAGHREPDTKLSNLSCNAEEEQLWNVSCSRLFFPSVDSVHVFGMNISPLGGSGSSSTSHVRFPLFLVVCVWLRWRGGFGIAKPHGNKNDDLVVTRKGLPGVKRNSFFFIDHILHVRDFSHTHRHTHARASSVACGSLITETLCSSRSGWYKMPSNSLDSILILFFFVYFDCRVLYWWRSKHPDKFLKGIKLNVKQALGSKLPNGLLNFIFKLKFRSVSRQIMTISSIPSRAGFYSS